MAANGSETAAGPSDLEKKIIRQVEYYFGDANLARDRFLQGKVKEDEGWVPLEIMIRFNRLKTLSDDFGVITTALAKSTSGLMEISEDKQKIRRSADKPIPNDTTEVRTEVKKRSIYCKGFSPDDSLDKVQSFLDEFGQVEHIQMRRDKDRKFKGSVFAVYEKEESVTKFLETKDLKIGETEAVIMLKDDYYKMKTDERKVRREEEKKEKQQAREQREQEAIDAQQADFGEFEKGCVMHFTGVTEQTTREDLKEVFGEYGSISWVEFERGLTEGCIRFDDDCKAADVIEKATKAAKDGKLIVRENEVTVRVLEGDEETEHWKQVYEQKSRIRLRKKMSGYGGRGGGRGGYGGRGKKNFKRGRDRDWDRPAKAAKFEGKKTKFDDSGDEEEKEQDTRMEEGGAEKKDAPEKIVKEEPAKPAVPSGSGDAPTAEKTVKEEPAKSAVPSGSGDAPTAQKTVTKQEPVKQEPVSSSPTKPAVKRPLEEETSEAEPAQKLSKVN